MTKDKTEIKVSGFFLEALTVLFIGLKLTGFIAWSWWLVFAPMWIPVAAILLIVVALLIVLGILKLID